jgi:hypothetical protein
MTQQAIRQQIEAIRKASADAGRSPETARQFLIAAGILKEEPQSKEKLESKSKNR